MCVCVCVCVRVCSCVQHLIGFHYGVPHLATSSNLLIAASHTIFHHLSSSLTISPSTTSHHLSSNHLTPSLLQPHHHLSSNHLTISLPTTTPSLAHSIKPLSSAHLIASHTTSASFGVVGGTTNGTFIHKRTLHLNYLVYTTSSFVLLCINCCHTHTHTHPCVCPIGSTLSLISAPTLLVYF